MSNTSTETKSDALANWMLLEVAPIDNPNKPPKKKEAKKKAPKKKEAKKKAEPKPQRVKSWKSIQDYKVLKWGFVKDSTGRAVPA